MLVLLRSQEVHRRLDELTQRADQLHEAATAHSNQQEQVCGGGGEQSRPAREAAECG
jgi:hypothetical protein